MLFLLENNQTITSTMKIKIFILSIALLFTSSLDAQNAFAKAEKIAMAFQNSPTLEYAADTFWNYRTYWKNKIGEKNPAYINIFNFVYFKKNPFANVDYGQLNVDKFAAFTKQYNNFVVLYKNDSTVVKDTPTLPKSVEDANAELADNVILMQAQQPFNIQVTPMVTDIGADGGLVTGPSRFIDGTARFLVKRTKEELESAFFERFKNDIDNNEMLKTLIPQTYLLLRYQDYAYIPSMSKTWTSAIATDLNNIPFGLCESIIKNEPELLDKDEVLAFLCTIMVAKQVSEGAKPYEILYMIDKKLANEKNKNLSNFINFSNALSMNLLKEEYKGKDDAWVSKKDYKALKTNGQKYFWAIFYAENQKIFERLGWKKSALKNAFDRIETAEEFLFFFDNIGSMLTSYNGDKAGQYINVTENLLGLFASAVKMDFVLRNDTDGFYESDFIKKHRPIAQNSITVLKKTKEKDYGAALLSTIHIIHDVFPVEKREAKSIKTTLFYLSFLTDVITTDDATSVQQVIERYALPTQSYRLKRNHSKSISLNAYPGLYAGRETLATSNNNGMATGISAPIGVSMDFGRSGKRKNRSIGIFVPVVDIGAAFSYRWGKDADAKGFPADLTWQQILSPGLFVYWGLPRSPLAFGIGGQVTPKLRSIKDGQAVIEETAFRFGVNATVDIPIFNFWKR
jgi:hypothetical protein